MTITLTLDPETEKAIEHKAARIDSPELARMLREQAQYVAALI